VPPDQDPPNPPEGDPTPPDPNAVTITVPQAEPPPAPPRPPRGGEPPQVFTTDDVERIRNEERARFVAEQQRADQLQNELAAFRQAEEQRQKEEEKARKDAERAAKKKEEEEMDLRQVMERRDQEWEQKLAEERREREKALAILEQERRYSGLQNYMAQRMMVDGERIAPQLRQLVAGNSEEEIDASIAKLIDITEGIAGETMQALQQQGAQRRTAGVTAPPIGPTDVAATSRTYTADELRDMSMEEYGRKEVREQLLSEAGRAYRNR
jgi:hypothetical protein